MLRWIVALLKWLPLRKREALIEAGYRSLPAADCWRNGRFATRFYYAHLKSLGWQPHTIIDVGAYHGDWTAEMLAAFPGLQAAYCMEALPEKAKPLKQRFSGWPVRVFQALVGPVEKAAVDFFAAESGSSVMQELSVTPKEMRQVSMTTLDKLLASEQMSGPLLLKLDVQGYELEVLKGAVQLLQQTTLVQLEVSWLDYNQGAPDIVQVLQAMDAHGFVPLELAGLHRRKDNWALMQTDIIFCRPDWEWRKKANDFTSNYEVVAF